MPLPIFTSGHAGQTALLLEQHRAALLTATLYATWKKANPGEDAKVRAYWDNAGPRPTTVKTPFGLAQLYAADVYHLTRSADG